MLKLISNELKKTLFRIRTYISMVLIVIIAGSMALLPILLTDSSVSKSINGDDWKQETFNHMEELEKNRQSALKKIEEGNDPESLEVMMHQAEYNELSEEIEKLTYSIDHHIPPVSNNNLFNNLLSASQSSTLITILIIIIAASILSDEYRYGTIKLLLIRPPSRIKILLSKLIAISIFIGLFMFLADISTLIVSLFVTDINASLDYVFSGSDKEIQHANFLLLFASNLVAQFFTILIIAILTFTLSTIISSTALVISLSLAIYFIADPVLLLLEQYSDIGNFLWFNYWKLNHFIAPYSQADTSLLTAILVNSLYCLPLIIVAFYGFKRKDILS